MRGVVICNPWGAEHINAHRALRQLSRKLSGAGLHVLRFDYFGTGDSAGDMTQTDLPGWENDIKSAIAELESITGSTRVSLIGLRLGATLAAKVAVWLDPRVNSLVLWDPVVDGRAYLDELYAASRLGPTADGQLVARPLVSRPPDLGGGHEILGFPITARMARELKELNLVVLAPDLLRRTLVVLSEPQLSCCTLGMVLGANDAVAPIIEQIEAVRCWIDPWPNVGASPVAVINRIFQWLA
jgi:pimeloyl-ACP methyl ester carboxylesterase